MANSEVVMFPNSVVHQSTIDRSLAQSAPGIQAAALEVAPIEQLLNQLRDIINGPQKRLTEARFDEFVEILGEEKQVTSAKIESVESALADAKLIAASALRAQTAKQEIAISQIEDQVSELRYSHGDTLKQLRIDMEMGLQLLEDALTARLAEKEMTLRGTMIDLSSSFVAHLAEDDRKWTHEREMNMTSLEQRIAQWRAEIQDERKEDLAEVATSMMDLGQRLLKLRQQ